MNKIINNNTDLLVVFFAIMCTALTFMRIMDVKDYIVLVSMVFVYKFGKGKTVDSVTSQVVG